MEICYGTGFDRMRRNRLSAFAADAAGNDAGGNASVSRRKMDGEHDGADVFISDGDRNDQNIFDCFKYLYFYE